MKDRDVRAVVVKQDKLAAEMMAKATAHVVPRGNIVVCGCAAEALTIVRKQRMLLGIMGLTFRDNDGLDLAHMLIRDELVGKLIVVSGRDDECTLRTLRTLRIDAYFNPTAEDPELLPTIITGVLGGKSFLAGLRCTPPGPGRELNLHDMLSPVELQVFILVGSGADEQVVASQLAISKNTVHKHLQNGMRKLATEVMREAIRRGYVRFANQHVLYPGIEALLSARIGKKRRRLLQQP